MPCCSDGSRLASFVRRCTSESAVTLFSCFAGVRESAIPRRCGARYWRRQILEVDVLMPSASLAYSQVIPRRFAWFRVTILDVSAGQANIGAEFDSRQLHQSGSPGP